MKDVFGVSTTFHMSGSIQLKAGAAKKINEIRVQFVPELIRPIPPHVTLFEMCFNTEHPSFSVIEQTSFNAMVMNLYTNLVSNVVFKMSEDSYRVFGKFISFRYDCVGIDDRISACDYLRDAHEKIIEHVNEITGCKPIIKYTDTEIVYNYAGCDFIAFPDYVIKFDQRKVHLSVIDESIVDIQTFIQTIEQKCSTKIQDLQILDTLKFKPFDIRARQGGKWK